MLLGHGLVRDQHGEEMHKSKGNAIPFDGAADRATSCSRHELKVSEQADLPEGGRVARKGRKKVRRCRPYPPMARLIRWLYCRHNPAANINFGPAPPRNCAASSSLKLWNTYAFFCNYARLDGFDPAAPQVPVKERPDIDRWILSDLQLLIQTARKAFETFNVMAFCLEAEEFVDDKLSNWYVRRNRRRFWKSEKGADKLAAYQTLYTVLATLTKLFAPVMPFLTETMYQNLRAGTAASRQRPSVRLIPRPTRR